MSNCTPTASVHVCAKDDAVCGWLLIQISAIKYQVGVRGYGRGKTSPCGKVKRYAN